MNIYHYHPITKEFLGVGVAEQDQLDVDNWLIPAHATTIEPESTDEGNVSVFGDDEWSQVVDNRGVVYWLSDGTRHTISELGNEIPDDALTEAPEEPPLTTEQIEKLRAVAYANPTTGSDRYFIEAARKRAIGDEDGAVEAEQQGVARVIEIKEAIQ